MSSSVVAVTEFPGLDLNSSPDNSGCIDMLNCDLTRPGLVETRPGYEAFVTPASVSAITEIAPHITSSVSKRQLLVAHSTTAPAQAVAAYSSAGALVATVTGLTGSPTSYAQWGSTTVEYTYFTNGTLPVRRWDGTTFTAPAGMPSPKYLAVQPADNRLVAVGSRTGGSADYSKVQFSEAGLPETWGSTDFVHLTPGDGQEMKGACAWRDYLFVFKKTKFFVFYGNSVDATGGAIFNYRAIDTGVGARFDGAVAPGGAEGVYFIGADGVYLTDGGPPVKISRALDPFFRGTGAPSMWQGGYLDDSASARMAYVSGRLYVVVGALTDAERAMFVYYPESGRWAHWDISAAGGMTGWTTGLGMDELYFSTARAATAKVFRLSPDVATDDGTAIVSRYRTGFTDFGQPGVEKRVNRLRLWGTGALEHSDSRDFGALGTAQAVTLGTSPAIADVKVLGNTRPGMNYSFELGASAGAWTVNTVVQEVDGRVLGHRV